MKSFTTFSAHICSVIILIIGSFYAVSAQQDDTTLQMTRPVQFTLFYPVGTNGTNTNIVNNFSLNLLFGINGGVNGIELGSIVNIDRMDVTGFQAAGFINGAGGRLHGVQAAGFANFADGDSKAGQAAGFMNIHGLNLKGVQAAGFMNINGGYIQGVQAAGFMNINGSFSEGVQAAGFANISGDSVNGLQGAGFANISAGMINGVQAAGFLNTSQGINGVQAAGFINISDGYVNGLQAAGFMNINGYDVQGAQIAGFLNVARNVKGVQISLINICDSINGVPVGLFSIVKSGYRKLEFFSNETYYFNLGFKMGVKRLYTIYTVGMQPFRGHFRYGLGVGLGSEIDLDEKTYMNIDAMAIHVNENVGWTEALNLHNQLRIIFGYRSADHFSVFAGPSLNVMVSRYFQPGTNRIGSGIPPWTMYNRTVNGTNVQIWPGVTVGFKF